MRAEISGDARAKLMMELGRDGKQREWIQTFVKGKGFVGFVGIDG